jgi:hypothetical protein
VRRLQGGKVSAAAAFGWRVRHWDAGCMCWACVNCVASDDVSCVVVSGPDCAVVCLSCTQVLQPQLSGSAQGAAQASV